MPTLVDLLTSSIGSAEHLAERFLELHVDDSTGIKQFDRTWTLQKIAKELNLSTGQISAALPFIPNVEPVASDKRLKEYSLSSLNLIRDHFGLSPCRAATDDPMVLSIMSGKGGVAKSTISIYLSQYLAIKGYRVLLVDSDPQSTVTTFALGVVPDAVFTQNDTISDCLLEIEPSLESKIVETPIEGLHLVPACQELQACEIVFTKKRQKQEGAAYTDMPADAWLKLRDGIDAASHNYDVVVIDTAPMVSNINLSVAFASNLIITPVTPSPIDFFSTVTYVKALAGYIDYLAKGYEYSTKDLTRLSSHRFLVSKQKSGLAHVTFSHLLRAAFKGHVYKTAFRESTEISNTLNNLNTILEKGRAVNSESTRITSLENIESLFDEVIQDIRAGWDEELPTPRTETIDQSTNLLSA